ncbi:MAG: AbrB/MazE/SpoVT family DNA-binding domain-containing protein [Opitutales bacterium]|nr:AbrB/MazE/SpoVT family DNA-binding domain-containing protein [Opitutales bacterium]
MLTKVSSKGQMVIPKSLRTMARIAPGDELEVGYSGGMIVLRKPEPLDTARIRRLMKEGRKLPQYADEHEHAVDAAIGRVRRRASRG